MENIAKISIETTSRSGDTVGTNCQLMGTRMDLALLFTVLVDNLMSQGFDRHMLHGLMDADNLEKINEEDLSHGKA